MSMAEHEKVVATNYVAILRNWKEVDPKVWAGLAGSVTVGGIVTVGATLGLTIPNWVAFLIVALVTFVASYLTKTKIPVPDDSGLTAQQAAAISKVAESGDELADADYQAAAAAAFAAAGIALDDSGKVVDTSHPLVQASPPEENTLAP
jgi:hypothetical protein